MFPREQHGSSIEPFCKNYSIISTQHQKGENNPNLLQNESTGK